MGAQRVWFQYHSYIKICCHELLEQQGFTYHLWPCRLKSLSYLSMLSSCAQILEAEKAACRTSKSKEYLRVWPLASVCITFVTVQSTCLQWLPEVDLTFVIQCWWCSGAAWLRDRSGHWYSKLDTLCQFAFHLWTLWTSLTAFTASAKHPKPCRRMAWQSNWKVGTSRKNANHLICKLQHIQ